MAGTLTKALIIAIPVVILLGASIAAVFAARTLPALLSLAGAACLAVTVLTHIAEGLRWFPQMRWGQPDSAGHYLDLASAVLGVALLGAAVVAKVGLRRYRLGNRLH